MLFVKNNEHFTPTTASGFTEFNYNRYVNALVPELEEAERERRAHVAPYIKNMVAPCYVDFNSRSELDRLRRLGWYLCDGTEGTPDLTGRFILGGSNYRNRPWGATGGSETVEQKNKCQGTIMTCLFTQQLLDI